MRSRIPQSARVNILGVGSLPQGPELFQADEQCRRDGGGCVRLFFVCLLSLVTHPDAPKCSKLASEPPVVVGVQNHRVEHFRKLAIGRVECYVLVLEQEGHLLHRRVRRVTTTLQFGCKDNIEAVGLCLRMYHP
jgi:hypothetical protein